MNTDELIQTYVTERLFWDDRADASKIQLSVDEGAVNLEGKVGSPMAKEAVSADAWQVNGVEWVNNDLDIRWRVLPRASGRKFALKVPSAGSTVSLK